MPSPHTLAFPHTYNIANSFSPKGICIDIYCQASAAASTAAASAFTCTADCPQHSLITVYWQNLRGVGHGNRGGGGYYPSLCVYAPKI